MASSWLIYFHVYPNGLWPYEVQAKVDPLQGTLETMETYSHSKQYICSKYSCSASSDRINTIYAKFKEFKVLERNFNKITNY